MRIVSLVSERPSHLTYRQLQPVGPELAGKGDFSGVWAGTILNTVQLLTGHY
jgi:hypothetical protein